MECAICTSTCTSTDAARGLRKRDTSQRSSKLQQRSGLHHTAFLTLLLKRRSSKHARREHVARYCQLTISIRRLVAIGCRKGLEPALLLQPFAAAIPRTPFSRSRLDNARRQAGSSDAIIIIYPKSYYQNLKIINSFLAYKLARLSFPFPARKDISPLHWVFSPSTGFNRV
ncbi:hypothetical protein TWF696_005992 [Orbilia brochopaga]|uniref:Uncharacterized protein n=1 Tax=Orbilia brochopaga TaxID=3140254 RepID=A0AAV9UY55_9PEZI